MRLPFWAIFVFALLAQAFVPSCAAALRWGGDSEGGFPYIFPNPENHDQLIGFEVDIVDEIAAYLGKKPVYVNNAWDNLIPGLNRGLYDMAINGLEVTPEHEEAVSFSIPYYKTFLQLAVRRENSDIIDLESCRGRVVGTLKESYAQVVLQKLGDVEIRTYTNAASNAYEDLQNGRIDAALFDFPIALYSAGFNPEIKFVGPPIGEITYAIAVTKGNGGLLRDINQTLVQLRDSGKLREIYDRWNLWNPMMAAEFGDYSPRRVPGTRYDQWIEAQAPGITLSARLERYAGFLPDFGRAAIVTMKVSMTAMLIAILLGIALVIARVFAPKWIVSISAAFIEFIRGTPVLIQLFFIFYGLPNIGVRLSPFWAGAIGLGINYAAYEAEIYRAGLFAIPSTQWEAALALGMTRWQAMREVMLPQAARVVIPPITNDFISLLKDSSLVSIITMVDLTKMYGQLAATYYDYFGSGIIVAFIYLLIGLPFVKFSRYAERRLAEQDKDGKRKHEGNFYKMSARWR
ncbi:MAG: ABC transporter substrate-binding protein/permease [Synergistaceae bacterium]|jgi:polar amino acid transport system substrate-binding protein|nr:ABC transporter substrate-binding protein/permease [Synergistaceae bacterium]